MEHTEIKQNPVVEVPAKQEPKPKKDPKVPQPQRKRKLMKWVKRLVLLAVIGVVAFFVLRGCSGGQGVGSVGNYLSYPVTRQDMVVSVTGTGTIAPINSYKVTTLIKGEVLAAPFEEGQTVHKGDLLFRMDSKDVENSIKQMERSVDQSKLALQQAQLNLNELLKNQSDNQVDRNIKSSATGTVTKVYINQGDKITAGTPVADILDRDNMKLTVPFHAVDVTNISLGQSASVTVDGTISTVYGTVDSIAATDTVGLGGTLVREVTIMVPNPGAIDHTSTGTAAVGAASCAQNGAFAYAAQKQLVAKASGEVETLNLNEGDKVTEHQVVGIFKDVDMGAQIENARISVKNVQIQLENAQLSLQNSRDKLEDYSITSTIDGTVIEKNVDTGDNIDGTASTAGASYPAVIYDLSALTFDIKIDELDISKIKVGQQVEITADALGGKGFTGTVDKVNINGTTAGGVTTYPVTVLVDGAPADLYPGMNVSAKIIVEEAGSVLCLPVDAVSRGDVVQIATPGALDDTGKLIDTSKLEDRQITMGRNDSQYIEVLDGLNEGDIAYVQNNSSNMMAAMMGG